MRAATVERAKVPWKVEFRPACGAWADGLTPDDQETLLAAVNVLRRLGPQLGRPLVDSIRHSRHSNMRDLRPPSTGSTEVRVLFAFDPIRQAVLLLGGDKSGMWAEWYRENVPIADARCDEHFAAMAVARTGDETPSPRAAGKRRGRKR